MDKNTIEFKNYRNAVENHWDPKDINVEQDFEGVLELANDDFYNSIGFDVLRKGLAMFGAGEKDVTEDLSPLAVVTEDIESQMFITTQLYEEAKHAEFFDIYWNEVINRVEKEKGLELTEPDDEKFFSESYEKLFKKNERAMKLLLDKDNLENRVKAYSHYHLNIEGILAQTGYWAFQKTVSPKNKETPNLNGLLDGFTKIRGDESRHVGFGVEKINQNISKTNNIDPVNEVCKELMPLINDIFLFVWEDVNEFEDYPAPTIEETLEYLKGEHSARLEKIKRHID